MMKRNLAAILLACAAISASAQTSIGIASGQPSGTNYPMVENIVKVCSTPGHPIVNVKSEGSLDNIYKISGDKNTQMGIFQEDAGVYQRGIDPKMMDKVQMVFPFFSTEIHIVVKDNSSIRSFADLQGKKVIEGPEGSGTWVTSQVIKGTTGITWSGYKMSQTEGLKAVQDGLVDAEFVVAGKPVTMLQNATGVRLIPIVNPKLDAFKYYTKAMIPSGTYAFQKTSIPTYKVANILAVYAFKNQYQKEIGDLAGCITRSMQTLQQDGHPKWKDVDPTDVKSIAWPIHPAALKAIQANSK